MVDLFNRERINKLLYNNNISISNYNLEKWWSENKLCQYIHVNYFQTAEIMKRAMQLLSRHILPPLQFNHSLEKNKICDSLNDFAKYGLYFHSFARQIVERMHDNIQFQFAPIQFDILIIPQATS
eukprot:8194_1